MVLTYKASVTAAEFLVLLEFQHNKLATRQQLSSFVETSNNHEKITIALLCFFLSASLTHALFFSMGPRVGASISQVKVNSTQGNTALASLQLEDHWGYHVGIFTRFDRFHFILSPKYS